MWDRYADSSALRELLRCPQCHADNRLGLHSTPVVCAGCGAAFDTSGDILDFVAGRDNTTLDVDCYDNQKQVTMDRSVAHFNLMKQRCGELLPDSLGRILEIGAGTGMLTLGMLSVNDFDYAIITDVSPEMLATCRARVERHVDPGKYSRTLFMTYSGKEDVFAEGAYDLCIANSVVHHILDYTAFFVEVRKALKPTGRALFLEPSYLFHLALTLAANDTLVAMIGDGTLSADADVKAFASWVAHLRASLIFADLDRSKMEDKHMFSRDDLALASRSAGFARATVLPWGSDPLGIETLNGYIHEIGISQQFGAVFFPRYLPFAKHHFQRLAANDKCAMYVVGLQVGADAN